MANQNVWSRVWQIKSIDFFGTPVPIDLPEIISLEELEEWEPFVEWKETLHQSLELQAKKSHAFYKHPYSLRKIEIQSVDRFGPTEIGFVKLNATIERDALSGDAESSEEPKPKTARFLPGIAFLRGNSVSILMILRPKDSREERYVILTEQPRIPAGSLAFLEIPAGMIKNDTFIGAAAKDVEQETGFRIPPGEFVNMTELALQNSEHVETRLQNAMYPSPGGCDESIGLFLWEKELDRPEIEGLKDRLPGLTKRNEMISLRIMPYEDLWKEAARDAKTLAAWALYEALNRSGILEEYRKGKRAMAISSNLNSQL